jgi:hypothetical protein
LLKALVWLVTAPPDLELWAFIPFLPLGLAELIIIDFAILTPHQIKQINISSIDYKCINIQEGIQERIADGILGYDIFEGG